MMNRLAATRAVLGLLTDEAVVTGLGNIAYDMYALGDRPLNFYTWGAMGTAVSIGLGLALARPERRVVVVEGDGSLVMNLNALATVGRYAPPNLACIVFDNEGFQITGGQATTTHRGRTDLAAVARACGIARAELVEEEAALEAAVRRALQTAGPSVVVAKVGPEITNTLPPRKPVLIKARFMEALGTAPEVDALVWSERLPRQR